MKICIIVPSFPPTLGGAEVGAYELSKKLSEDNEVIVLTKSKKNARKIENFGRMKVMRIFPNVKSYMLSFFILGFLYSLFYLKKIKPDICNIHYIIPYGLGSLIACKLMEIPTVLTIVGWDIYDPLVKPRMFYRPCIRYCLKIADRVVSVSNFIKKKAQEIWYNRMDIKVIPYGIDINKFRPRQRREMTNKYKLGDTKVILAVQRLHARKRVSVLIKSLSFLKRKFEKFTLLVVGDGPDKENLMELTKKLRLEEKIVYCGKVEQRELPSYYKSADIFALHTLHEGLGIVILEAMSSGLPVVTTKAGGTEDLVENGKNGFLVSKNDPKKMGTKILYLLKNPRIRKRMGKMSRKIAEEKYSWEMVTDKYKELFNSLVE